MNTPSFTYPGTTVGYSHDRRVAADRLAAVPVSVEVLSRDEGLRESELVRMSRCRGKVLGTGTFGRVHTVALPEYQNDYVLKVSRKSGNTDLAGWKESCEVIQGEVRELIKLDHRCIVKYHGGVFDRRIACGVMERLDETLGHALHKGHTPNLTGRLKMAGDVIDGLCYLHHEHNLGHYDLHCFNVMQSSRQPGRPVLKLIDMDFTGKIVSANSVNSYMDPESCRVKDEKSDVFSAGGIIYSLMIACPWCALWDQTSESRRVSRIKTLVSKKDNPDMYRDTVDCSLSNKEKKVAAQVIVNIVGGCLDLNRDKRLSLIGVKQVLEDYCEQLVCRSSRVQ